MKADCNIILLLFCVALASHVDCHAVFNTLALFLRAIQTSCGRYASLLTTSFAWEDDYKLHASSPRYPYQTRRWRFMRSCWPAHHQPHLPHLQQQSLPPCHLLWPMWQSHLSALVLGLSMLQPLRSSAGQSVQVAEGQKLQGIAYLKVILPCL